MSNTFDEIFEKLEKRKNDALRDELKIFVGEYVDYVVKYFKDDTRPTSADIEDDRFPERTRIEPHFGRASARLHGGQRIFQNFSSGVIKERNKPKYKITIGNEAPQAKYYFPGTLGHLIEATSDSRPLMFFRAGRYLWGHMETDGTPEGQKRAKQGFFVRRKKVKHPGAPQHFTTMVQLYNRGKFPGRFIETVKSVLKKLEVK